MYAPLENRTRMNNDQKRKDPPPKKKQNKNYYLAALTLKKEHLLHCFLTRGELRQHNIV